MNENVPRSYFSIIFVNVENALYFDICKLTIAKDHEIRIIFVCLPKTAFAFLKKYQERTKTKISKIQINSI